jgi:hypothetical protein
MRCLDDCLRCLWELLQAAAYHVEFLLFGDANGAGVSYGGLEFCLAFQEFEGLGDGLHFSSPGSMRGS